MKFSEGDEVALLINNFGGMSVLELGALTNEFLEQLPSHISRVRVYTGIFESSLNAPAFALTICNLTATTKNAEISVPQLLELLDARTETAWEGVVGNQIQKRARVSQLAESPLTQPPNLPEPENLKGNTTQLPSAK